MKKILVFSSPFGGHLNILKDFIKRYDKDFKFQLVITSWKNIILDLSDLKGRNAEYIILSKSSLNETDPALWTFPRVNELLSDCLALAREFKPNLIIYDFFSLEGFLVSKILGIPCWSSIPAMFGPFENRNYLHKKFVNENNKISLLQIKNNFGIKISEDDLEMISDGLHIPGDINLIWSYPCLYPKDFIKNRKKRRYAFVGRIDEPMSSKIESSARKKVKRVYFSLGTVVLNNLWNQQKETRAALKNFIFHLARILPKKGIKFVFVSQNKKILPKYPSNWKIVNFAKQKDELAKSDIFITHGGGNSLNEAVLERVPMIVIPFFGDQPLIAKRISSLGIGVNLVESNNIDTKKSKNFLNKYLAIRLNSSLNRMLSDKSFKENYNSLKLERIDIMRLIKNEI